MSVRDADAIPPRYEYKYLLNPAQAARARAMIEPFCVMDSFSAKAPGNRYLITSLYLDTPSLGCWNAWALAADRRFKLRVRRYGTKLGDSPVFFEIKQKVMDVTIKPRAFIAPEQWLERARYGTGESRAEKDFCIKRDRYRLQPTLLVRYEREAWKGRTEAYARITFDQRLQFQKCDEWTLDGDDKCYRAADDPVATGELGGAPLVLMEVKFERDLPRWMVHLIRSLELDRRGFSKYGIGVRRTFDRGELLDASRRESIFD
jgi:SPX domain protein involved in polyphosphate accumulation